MSKASSAKAKSINKSSSNKGCCGRLFCECPCIKYSHLLHMDLLLLICHAFAAFVLYNRNMLLPIVTIRAPRLMFRILDTFCLRKGENEGKEIKRRCPCC